MFVLLVCDVLVRSAANAVTDYELRFGARDVLGVADWLTLAGASCSLALGAWLMRSSPRSWFRLVALIGVSLAGLLIVLFDLHPLGYSIVSYSF